MSARGRRTGVGRVRAVGGGRGDPGKRWLAWSERGAGRRAPPSGRDCEQDSEAGVRGRVISPFSAAARARARGGASSAHDQLNSCTFQACSEYCFATPGPLDPVDCTCPIPLLAPLACRLRPRRYGALLSSFTFTIDLIRIDGRRLLRLCPSLADPALGPAFLYLHECRSPALSFLLPSTWR